MLMLDVRQLSAEWSTTHHSSFYTLLHSFSSIIVSSAGNAAQT